MSTLPAYLVPIKGHTKIRFTTQSFRATTLPPFAYVPIRIDGNGIRMLALVSPESGNKAVDVSYYFPDAVVDYVEHHTAPSFTFAEQSMIANGGFPLLGTVEHPPHTEGWFKRFWGKLKRS